MKGVLKSNISQKLMFLDRVVAVASLGKWIWAVLGAGYLWLLVSYAMRFSVPAAGSVLVCSAIVSDLLFQMLRWRALASFFGNNVVQRLEDQENGEFVGYQSLGVERETIVAEEPIRTLSKLATNDISADRKSWVISTTLRRAELIVILPVAFTAVFGTLVWAYYPS